MRYNYHIVNKNPRVNVGISQRTITPMTTSNDTTQITYGYCHCGCGQKTSLNPHSDSNTGMIKGEPRRFIVYHAARVRSVGHYKTRRASFQREDGTIEIALTKGYTALVSPEDGDLAEYNWNAHKRNQFYYAARANDISIHIIVLERMLGRSLAEGEIVDHIDRNTFDNRRHNLRLADTQKNNFNSGIRKDNTSGYKGVKKTGNKWSARIWANGKRMHLGSFVTAELAHEAYCNASKLYHGEFGRT